MNVKKPSKTKSYKSIGEIILDMTAMLRPPERLSVAAAAEKYRYINQPGAYVGQWKNVTAPYMVEPMNTFTSRQYSGMIFVGPAQSGKALCLKTPIATLNGWKTMGTIEIGDALYDESGKACEVFCVSPVMHDHECFQVCFAGCAPIVADADHLWLVLRSGASETVTTRHLNPDTDVVLRHDRAFKLDKVLPHESVPVRCIGVTSPSRLFQAGLDRIPTHNTDALVINTLAYSIKVDPMDMMVVCPTMLDARDFGIRRVDRLHRHSEQIGEMLLPSADADNRYDKQYTTGMLFTLSWPTPSQLAGKPIGRIVLTDRDRMVDDVEGDGEPFDLASKRTTTFGSYAMTVAESSPSREVSNPKWIPQSPHEAPPCEGILKLYNRGDRRRWYWPCPHCGEYFEGMFKHLIWDADLPGTNLEKAATVKMACPHNGCVIVSDDRDEMNFWGQWVKDGQGVDNTGRVFGPEPRTSIASFWLRGVAAAFTSWRKLVEMYLNANDEYARTGSEEALKKFYNNDLGEPYTPRSQGDIRLPEVLKARAEKLTPRHVPKGVRFLVAAVDVQKNMFVVQVYGILPGLKFDMVLVDRFDIRKSKRTDHDDERLWVKPSAYVEDWDEITEHVIDKEYSLDDGSGRMMGIKIVGCDSGGRAGVTSMAYSYYRRLVEQNKHRRFILLKGDPSPNQPRTRISYPDSQKKDMKAGARGDIPILLLQSNLLKDDLDGRLDCIEPGKGMMRFPDWLSDSFFSEMCVEVRTEKGWENLSGQRNEAWDLSYYPIGLCVSELIRAEKIKWDDPPGWAAEWDKNDLVRKPEEKPRFANPLQSAYDFSSFAKALA